MKFTITFEVSDAMGGYRDVEEAVEVVEDAVDHLLINLDLHPESLSVKVER